MRKIALALFIIVILALLAAPVSAQEIVTNTPAATAAGPVVVNPPVVAPSVTDATATYWIFAAVIFGLLATIVLVLRPLIVQLGASAPRWAVDAAYSAGSTLLDKAADYAGTTPSKVDDDLVVELRAQIDSLRAEIDKLRTPSNPTG